MWTLHPSYLDARRLVALWREALLAQAVLSRTTGGYQHHPQLARFKACTEPNDSHCGVSSGGLCGSHPAELPLQRQTHWPFRPSRTDSHDRRPTRCRVAAPQGET
nr:pyrimidine dimer DNA glycosylase/endonuclease V [Nitrosomonas communis]